MENTIVAISTAMGNGGIGIVRMSGEKSFEILEILLSKDIKLNMVILLIHEMRRLLMRF